MLSRKVKPPGQPQKMAVGIVGPGQIGKTLLSQLSQQQEYMQERLGVDVQLQGVTSSSKMLVGSDQLNLASWQQAFEGSGQQADMKAFTEHFTSLDSEACIFDCTAADAPCEWYEQWLAGGVHIVTPNKKLHSGPLEKFKAVKSQQAKGAAHYFYEGSCGAGLPVLNTLKGLIESGDKVISIEGILSGTLSYIFNTWKAGEPFSEVVMKAKELGYTEPDPREDLSGMDVARKVTILARECGSDAVLESLSVNSLVPEALRDADVATFLEQLPQHDSDMAAELEKAQSSGDVLRYVGKYDAQADSCNITLARYPASHPFAQLKGTDNIVQIRTQRYDDFPLIIRGPGAGPDVTAGGCFADFLQLLRYLGARS